MSSQITYNELFNLKNVPTGGVASAIHVTVEIEPADASCLIYGWMPDKNLGYVHVNGGQTNIDLPFAHPEIYVKYLGGLQNFRISTHGYSDSRGAFDPFPIPTDMMPQKQE